MRGAGRSWQYAALGNQFYEILFSQMLSPNHYGIEENTHVCLRSSLSTENTERTGEHIQMKGSPGRFARLYVFLGSH